MAAVTSTNQPDVVLVDAGIVNATPAVFLHPTGAAVVLSNIAGVFSMALWIVAAEKVWARHCSR